MTTARKDWTSGSFSDNPNNMPMRRSLSRCCAHTATVPASGNVAALAASVITSRRLIFFRPFALVQGSLSRSGLHGNRIIQVPAVAALH
jgi:hypothetical protein